MIFIFNNYSVNIDVEKTREAYKSLPSVEEKCSCVNCRNFTKAILQILGEDGIQTFREMGLEPTKPAELGIPFFQGNEILVYTGFYTMIGEVIGNRDIPPNVIWSDEYSYSINKDVEIFIRDDSDILRWEEVFPGNILQMEFFVRTPWTLEEPYDANS